MEAATLIVIVLDLYFAYDQAVGAPGSDLRRHRHVPELAVVIPQISARSTVRMSPRGEPVVRIGSQWRPGHGRNAGERQRRKERADRLGFRVLRVRAGALCQPQLQGGGPGSGTSRWS